METQVKPTYLNASGAATYLGLSRATFWRLRESHPLKCYSFDGVTRYNTADLDQWAEQFKEKQR